MSSSGKAQVALPGPWNALVATGNAANQPGSQTPRWRQLSQDMVQLDGAVVLSAGYVASTGLFTAALPVGSRPTILKLLPPGGSPSAGISLQVSAAGVVSYQANGAAVVALDGAVFPTT